jgi:hypothetical protein
MSDEVKVITYERYVADIVYGCVNGVMCAPVMISFCSIIFRHPSYSTYMPVLVKLVLFSSMIHQISFTLFSTLPLAVGQVKNAGLIFHLLNEYVALDIATMSFQSRKTTN